MGELAYYLLWLLAGLLVAALVSASLAARWRRHVERRAEALALLDALSRYAVWAAAQLRNTAFSLQHEAADLALVEACGLQERAFPELEPPLADLLAAHRRLADFPLAQQAQRQGDPEAGLETDSASERAALWHDHQAALAALTQRLQEEAEGAGARPAGTP